MFFKKQTIKYSLVFLCLAAIAFSASASSNLTPSQNPTSLALSEKEKTELTASSVLYFANASRQKQGLTMLASNPRLQKAAQAKALDMAKKSYFSHTSPDGTTPWQWMDKENYRYSAAGENLAEGFDHPQEVVDGWINSPTHKKNLFNPVYSETGIGVARGKYKNEEVIFVVEIYARPRAISTFLSRF